MPLTAGAMVARGGRRRRVALTSTALLVSLVLLAASSPQALRRDAGTAGTAGGAAFVQWSYWDFARSQPAANNVLIATSKTLAADLLAQMAGERKTLGKVDWRRNLVFGLFGLFYLGLFQYWYQINIFKRMFPNMEQFAAQPLAEKLTDVPGLRDLLAQTVMDLMVLMGVYLPTFYIFKASVFSTSWDPTQWIATGLKSYSQNRAKDCSQLLLLWGPGDLICFSVPLYLRLPVRHIGSFVWTVYLSFARGGQK